MSTIILDVRSLSARLMQLTALINHYFYEESP